MPKTAKQWVTLLFYLHRHHRTASASVQWLLQRAIQQRAWHVVMHLVTLGMDTAQRDLLLADMIKRRQWDVSSVLLEQGVSVQSCLDALPDFMEMHQWTLVSRLREFVVNDHIKHQVIQCALAKREGSLVWRCLSTMQQYYPSVHERNVLFRIALKRGMWQLLKPLIEIKDNTGIRHRDTALLAAIEQRQWDVVDYCQLNGADIDMKD
jgi:hypothetical protein